MSAFRSLSYPLASSLSLTVCAITLNLSLPFSLFLAHSFFLFPLSSPLFSPPSLASPGLTPSLTDPTVAPRHPPLRTLNPCLSSNDSREDMRTLKILILSLSPCLGEKISLGIHFCLIAFHVQPHDAVILVQTFSQKLAVRGSELPMEQERKRKREVIRKGKISIEFSLLRRVSPPKAGAGGVSSTPEGGQEEGSDLLRPFALPQGSVPPLSHHSSEKEALTPEAQWSPYICRWGCQYRARALVLQGEGRREERLVLAGRKMLDIPPAPQRSLCAPSERTVRYLSYFPAPWLSASMALRLSASAGFLVDEAHLTAVRERTAQ